MYPIITIAIFFAIISIFGGLIFKRDYVICEKWKYNSLERSRDFLNKTIKTKQGADTDGSYLYLSTNGGKDWYEAMRDSSGFTIGKSVSDSTDELFSKRTAMSMLMDHVIKKGPLNPMKPLDRKILEKAGFAIVKKDKD